MSSKLYDICEQTFIDEIKNNNKGSYVLFKNKIIKRLNVITDHNSVDKIDVYNTNNTENLNDYTLLDIENIENHVNYKDLYKIAKINNKLHDKLFKYYSHNTVKNLSFNKEDMNNIKFDIISLRNNYNINFFCKPEEIVFYAKIRKKIINKSSQIVSFKRGFTIHNYYIYNEGLKIMLQYKPKLLFYFPKTGLAILENEFNKNKARYEYIRRGSRHILEYNPNMLDLNIKTSTIDKNDVKLLIGPIFEEIDKASNLNCTCMNNFIIFINLLSSNIRYLFSKKSYRISCFCFI